MPSIRSQTLERLRVRFEADGLPVFRSRTAAIARKEGSAIIVRPAQVQTRPFSDEADHNEFQVAIEVASRGDPWEDVADLLLVSAHPLVLVPSTDDGPLLWHEVRPESTDFQARDADVTAGTAIQIYRFTYLSAVADLTKPIG